MAAEINHKDLEIIKTELAKEDPLISCNIITVIKDLYNLIDQLNQRIAALEEPKP